MVTSCVTCMSLYFMCYVYQIPLFALHSQFILYKLKGELRVCVVYEAYSTNHALIVYISNCANLLVYFAYDHYLVKSLVAKIQTMQTLLTQLLWYKLFTMHHMILIEIMYQVHMWLSLRKLVLLNYNYWESWFNFVACQWWYSYMYQILYIYYFQSSNEQVVKRCILDSFYTEIDSIVLALKGWRWGPRIRTNVMHRDKLWSCRA